MEEKIIQDPIHGNITFEDWVIDVIDTPCFQRLRRIKQIGFGNLVYPGANHTRFEHSIGTMHVAKLLTQRMDISEKIKDEIIAAALIHDLGHPPFSHSSENLINRYLGLEHEDIRSLVKDTEIRDVLVEKGLRLGKILQHVKGESNIDIVSGDIDADRMDYLVRDSYYTGVAYGVFDLMRLVNKIHFEGQRIIIGSGGLRAAESLLISRFMMYPTVYFHHVCRIAEKMYEKAVEKCLVDDLIAPEKLFRMDDYDIISFLRNQNGYPGDIISRIDSRRLMKRAIYVGLPRIGVDVSKVDSRHAEEEIAEISHVDPQYVIVDIPPLEETRELGALVDVDGELMKLEEVSPLVHALKSGHGEGWKMGVYTPEEHRDKVAIAAADYFEIEKIKKQKRLDEVLPLW
ncbi:MAG: HD domain-containing protein [Archaeoglobaceae archaeon]